MNTESSLYRYLSQQEMALIVKKHFHTDHYSYYPITGGLFNTTYYLETGEGRYVLRVGPVNRELLLAFELNLMEAEVFAYELCREIGVPVSEVVAWDDSKTLIDRDYMLVTYIDDSSPLLEQKLPQEEKDRLYLEVGRYAAQIHSITSDFFGRVKGKQFTCWSHFFEYELSDWREKVLKHKVYTEAEVEQIISVYEKYQELLDEVKAAHLLHTDLWEGNILIRKEKDQYQVAAIIDMDRAVFGDIDFEIASGWMINESFLKGYGKLPEETKNSSIRKLLYRIFYHILDSYFLKVEYNKTQDSLNTKKTVFELLQELKELEKREENI